MDRLPIDLASILRTVLVQIALPVWAVLDSVGAYHPLIDWPTTSLRKSREQARTGMQMSHE